jgi:hypothetical protein
MVHEDSAFLIINLGVDSCITDEVDDPFLALVLVQAQTGGQVPEIILASIHP